MQKPSITYWTVAIILTLWNGFGLFAVFGDPQLLGYGQPEPEQLKLLDIRPIWTLIGSASSVIAGVLACLMMLARNKLAILFFGISLLGFLVQNIWFFGSETTRSLLPPAFPGLQLTILVSIIIGIWMCRRASSKGWMR
ncbi:MAG: hypothetical protein AAGH53_08955 [Pseudomonadota bacterium]